jgi:hypothetical protein
MEGKENILEELRSISAFVAGISRETPYGLPEGYFEDLAGKVLLHIRTGVPPRDQESGLLIPDFISPELPIRELLGSADPAPLYSVPTGYFEGFAEKLMDRIKAGQRMGEEADISRPPLEKTAIPFPKVTGQSSPEDPAISPLEELAILSPLLSRIDKKMPFGIPEGYFSSLPEVTTQNAKENDYSSPLLANLKNKSAYQAPEHYFDTLAERILEKAQQQNTEQEAAPVQQPVPAKVISFDRSRSQRRNWWKYTAAAVMTGLILTGGWLKLHTPPPTGPVDITKSLSNVSDQEIQNYLDNQNLPLSDELANTTASLDISDNDIKSLLGDIPDGELKQYIDENGDTKDLATN